MPRLTSNNAAPRGLAYGGNIGVDPELGIDVVDMRADRADRNPQSLRDIFAPLALRNHFDNFNLASAERGLCIKERLVKIRTFKRLEQVSGDLRANRAPALQERVNALANLMWFFVFKYVAFRTRAEGL